MKTRWSLSRKNLCLALLNLFLLAVLMLGFWIMAIADWTRIAVVRSGSRPDSGDRERIQSGVQFDPSGRP